MLKSSLGNVTFYCLKLTPESDLMHILTSKRTEVEVISELQTMLDLLSWQRWQMRSLFCGTPCFEYAQAQMRFKWHLDYFESSFRIFWSFSFHSLFYVPKTITWCHSWLSQTFKKCVRLRRRRRRKARVSPADCQNICIRHTRHCTDITHEHVPGKGRNLSETPAQNLKKEL